MGVSPILRAELLVYRLRGSDSAWQRLELELTGGRAYWRPEVIVFEVKS